MQKFAIEISKTIKKGEKLADGKVASDNIREKVGTIHAYTPLMDDVLKYAAAATQAQKLDDKNQPVFEKNEKGEAVPVLAFDDDGLPVYQPEEASWIFGAIVAAVKAGARNKCKQGTAEVKDGLKIPENWAELVAEGTRSGSAALAALRDCQADFAKYIATLGKKEATQVTIVTLFKNKEALGLQDKTMKGKIKEYVEAFAATLSEEDLDKYDKPLTRVLAICDEESEDPLSDM